MVKEQGSGQSAARVTSYLMQPWQLRRHNLSRMTPRIGWWWGWRACMSARWSIRCCALAWSSETVSGRHLQGTQQKALIWGPAGMLPPWKRHSKLVYYLRAGSITVQSLNCNVDTKIKCPHLYSSSTHSQYLIVYQWEYKLQLNYQTNYKM